MQSKEDIKAYLLDRLFKENAFWSYDKESCKNISDFSLVKYSLRHLDLDDIDLLFKIYPKQYIKRIWLDELVPQGDYLLNMNICFAVIYFNIKHPLTYLKRMETFKLNRIAT